MLIRFATSHAGLEPFPSTALQKTLQPTVIDGAVEVVEQGDDDDGALVAMRECGEGRVCRLYSGTPVLGGRLRVGSARLYVAVICSAVKVRVLPPDWSRATKQPSLIGCAPAVLPSDCLS